MLPFPYCFSFAQTHFRTSINPILENYWPQYCMNIVPLKGPKSYTRWVQEATEIIVIWDEEHPLVASCESKGYTSQPARKKSSKLSDYEGDMEHTTNVNKYAINNKIIRKRPQVKSNNEDVN